MKYSTMTQPEEHQQETVTVSPMERLMAHVLSHKIEMTILFTRLLTIMFTILYFIPIFGNLYSSYNKALIANAATSALRLHQRHPRITYSVDFFKAVLREDSCHYFAYSMIFLYVAPFTLALLPVFLFALIQCASYSLILLDILGQNSWCGMRLLISFVELQSSNILNLIACVEIILLPFCIILILLGRAGLLTSIVYYRFLLMRCKSQRNATTRNLFTYFLVSLANVANRPATSDFVRMIINFFIRFLSRLFPIAVQ
ncbi:Krueppel homolog 2 [Cimex lectularius]|uniref:Uncharacterized protein n=1 Tax=Cimex lectularius TaxID=79782 RepID=A0A8I6RUU7_CIMLE|nr:Krueppel homolog 2 [Cimex lectularius]